MTTSTMSITNENLKNFSTLDTNESVTRLHINDSHIASFDDISYVFPNLAHMSIHSSHVDRMKELHFVPLKTLTIRDHSLTDPRETLPNLDELTSLDLSHGKLYELRLPLLLHSLEELVVNHNELSTIRPMNATTMNNLTTIELKNNKLKSLRDFPKNLPHLSKLDVSFNEIKEYPLTYPLTHLTISHNTLETISLPQSIEKADVSSNNLRSITFEGEPKNLTYFDVSHNQLETLEWFPSMKEFHVIFEHNPIRSFKGLHKKDFDAFVQEYYAWDIQNIGLSSYGMELLGKCHDSLQHGHKKHCNHAYNYVKHDISQKIDILNTSDNRSARKLAKQYIDHESVCDDVSHIQRITDDEFRSKMKNKLEIKCDPELKGDYFPSDQFIYKSQNDTL